MEKSTQWWQLVNIMIKASGSSLYAPTNSHADVAIVEQPELARWCVLVRDLRWHTLRKIPRQKPTGCAR